MRVESSFFDKSSSRFILERARGLGILTFDKIRKIAFRIQNQQIQTKTAKYAIILSENIFVKNYI